MQRFGNDASQTQFSLFDFDIQVPELRLQVKALLDEKVLDGALNRALTICDRKASKSSGVNGVRIRMSKAVGEMRCDSNVARTVFSPLVLISSGRYSFGRRAWMTLLLVSAVSGVRLKIVSIRLPPAGGHAPLLGNDMMIFYVTILWNVAGYPVTRSCSTSRLKMPL